jgi:hypothetical protein
VIREEVLYQFYQLPRLIAREALAIRTALPYWIGANVFLNRDKEKDALQKNEWPPKHSASEILKAHGIDWGYERGQVRFCHIEYELRRQAAEVIFDVDNPRRHNVREEVVALLSDVGVNVEADTLGYRCGDTNEQD